MRLDLGEIRRTHLGLQYADRASIGGDPALQCRPVAVLCIELLGDLLKEARLGHQGLGLSFQCCREAGIGGDRHLFVACVVSQIKGKPSSDTNC